MFGAHDCPPSPVLYRRFILSCLKQVLCWGNWNMYVHFWVLLLLQSAERLSRCSYTSCLVWHLPHHQPPIALFALLSQLSVNEIMLVFAASCSLASARFFSSAAPCKYTWSHYIQRFPLRHPSYWILLDVLIGLCPRHCTFLKELKSGVQVQQSVISRPVSLQSSVNRSMCLHKSDSWFQKPRKWLLLVQTKVYVSFKFM